MRCAGALILLVALGGCGNGGIEGTLKWEQPPSVSANSLKGGIQNTTSHSVALDPKSMRLLDDNGKKVAGRIRVASNDLSAGASTRLNATWKAGNPVRIDYGAGTLALPSD